ncbi:Dynamin-like GTPase that mediates homotypic ER fusion [Ascosphaera pollenicola]|nr:Dynamin-like GTPase that mediates homotypic ER fusion [Ascosphaera pollenicola]
MEQNAHMASVHADGDAASYSHGVQVVGEDKDFNHNLGEYLAFQNVTPAGFNYHLISVFGSQSTGKSTLLNCLFGTDFNVMSETERRQTTKGIWLSKNKKGGEDAAVAHANQKMADNILVMDVEGTDGRERGEDQDFERKSALFALATSEVLIVNIWEHQVGLYQGANMGLLKTVFEVNLQLFLKDNASTPRSLLFFVIRDYVGNTPLENLKATLIQDMTKIWQSLAKPPGLEGSNITDYFDFEFAGLPHKKFQPKEFDQAVDQLGMRFCEGRKDVSDSGILLPEYHRRIPADGFAHYAEGIWDQIESNKDLDLPTQQELLAQFRCDEIAREALIQFDEIITPYERKQGEFTSSGEPVIMEGLGDAMRDARAKALKKFDTEASRYHKKVYTIKKAELEGKTDTRLKALFQGQLSAAHRAGIQEFSDNVTTAVKAGQKQGANYNFAEIVSEQKNAAVAKFTKVAEETTVGGAPWSTFQQENSLFDKELEKISGQLRRDELRRLATRVERWVKSRVGEALEMEFNALGSARNGAESASKPSEFTIWDRVWTKFVSIVNQAEERLAERAASFAASADEIVVGRWRLRRKSWDVLRAKLNEILMESNLLLKLRENFEDRFRYDDAGVPRIWRPTDDIEGIYTRARESTLGLVPVLSRFRLAETSEPPPLDEWIGSMPKGATAADEEDLHPIGGIDDEEGKTLEDETTILNESKSQDLIARFRKTADGIFVEAKRSAIGGITQVPLYFYGLLLALGWNEMMAVLRNPIYFILLALCSIAAYITWQLNLWGPMIRMTNAATEQAIAESKRRLRDFLSDSDTNREAVCMRPREATSTSFSEEFEMSDLKTRSSTKMSE